MFIFKAEMIVNNPFVVYTLHDGAGVIQHIGSCRFNTVLSTPDARKNTLFSNIFPDENLMTIQIVFHSELRKDCQNYVWQWLQQNPRPFMMQFGARVARNKPVLCVETGQIFKSVSEAARVAGVAQSYMSNHIQRRPGYTSVRGNTYEWAVNQQLQEDKP